MTQDNPTDSHPREVRLRQKREQHLAQIAEMQEAQAKVAQQLLDRSKALSGHFRLAHEFGAKMVGQLMYAAGWHHWTYTDDEAPGAARKRVEWSDFSDSACAPNRLMAMVTGSNRDEALQSTDAMNLQTHEDLVSVLRIASYLPGIDSDSVDVFAGLSPEDFSPRILGRLYKTVHTTDQELAEIEQRKAGHRA